MFFDILVESLKCFNLCQGKHQHTLQDGTFEEFMMKIVANFDENHKQWCCRVPNFSPLQCSSIEAQSWKEKESFN